MGKFKPFLFGALFGAGTVFIGLQYHVVQSLEGIRVVPRTPQHAIGLAYVDIRNWGAEQWADRPELARALVAHGSTDLVAASVTEGLVESISSESSILDELRGFAKESPDSNDADSLFDDSDFAPIKAPSDSNNQGLITIPFEDARRKRSGDTASTANSANRQSRASRDINSNSHEPAWKQTYRSDDTVVARAPVTGQRDKPSVDDVFGTGRSEFSSQSYSGTDGPESESDDTSTELTADQETNLLEGMLFGDQETSSRKSRLAGADAGRSGFDDITNTLDNRAEQALKRARAGFQQPTNQAFPRAADSTDRYVRDRASDSHADHGSSMFSADASKTESFSERMKQQLPDPLKAIRDGFDPFVE